MPAMRNIVKIDQEKCNGCGQCVNACAERAIALVNGKARLVSDTYCDGLGACLGDCPVGAITIEQRPAHPFDEAAAHAHVQRVENRKTEEKLPCGCPGTMARTIERKHAPAPAACCTATAAAPRTSQLSHWPVQLKLVSPTAKYLQNADLLLVADCVPFAFADFHDTFLKGNPVVVGCPKLDDAGYYVQKLSDILTLSSIASLTVIHMEVPCCSGLCRIAEAALQQSGSTIPVRDITIGIDGSIISEK